MQHWGWLSAVVGMVITGAFAADPQTGHVTGPQYTLRVHPGTSGYRGPNFVCRLWQGTDLRLRQATPPVWAAVSG